MAKTLCSQHRGRGVLPGWSLVSELDLECYNWRSRIPQLRPEVKWKSLVMSDSLQPHGLYSPWNSPGHNTGVGSLSLLQGVFPAQGLNPGLLSYRRILYQLSHQGSLIVSFSSLLIVVTVDLKEQFLLTSFFSSVWTILLCFFADWNLDILNRIIW